MSEIRVDFEIDVAEILGKTAAEVAREMRLAAATQWYAQGLITPEQATEIGAVGRGELLAALAARGTRASPERLATGGPAAAEARSLVTSPETRYSLTLFGAPSVCRIDAAGEEVEIGWRLRKAFESVVFLALAPDRRATKEAIIDAVWPDADVDTIRKNFHPALSEARRTLVSGLSSGQASNPIVFRQGSYLLDPELDWDVDAARFEGLIAAGRELLAQDAGPRALELWQRAWSLYRGPLLAGLEGSWIVLRRELYRREYLRLLRDIGQVAELLGRDTLALDAYRSVLLEEPYEERVHLAMMQLYSRQGRRDLVRRQYVKLQELLLKELNVEPLEETQERYHRLMR